MGTGSVDAWLAGLLGAEITAEESRLTFLANFAGIAPAATSLQ